MSLPRRDLTASSLGRMINHRPLLPQSDQARRRRAHTEVRWVEMFPGEPFSLQQTEKVTDFTSTFTYDIMSASHRQKVFYYQVT